MIFALDDLITKLFFFPVEDLVTKERKKQQDLKRAKLEVETGLAHSAEKVIAEQTSLDLPNVNFLMQFLASKKQQLEQVRITLKAIVVHQL